MRENGEEFPLLGLRRRHRILPPIRFQLDAAMRWSMARDERKQKNLIAMTGCQSILEFHSTFGTIFCVKDLTQQAIASRAPPDHRNQNQQSEHQEIKERRPGHFRHAKQLPGGKASKVTAIRTVTAVMAMLIRMDRRFLNTSR